MKSKKRKDEILMILQWFLEQEEARAADSDVFMEEEQLVSCAIELVEIADKIRPYLDEIKDLK